MSVPALLSDGGFQSTLPLRGATPHKTPPPAGGGARSGCVPAVVWRAPTPPAPGGRGATPEQTAYALARMPISIHAPREGSDAYNRPFRRVIWCGFQSTLPVRGATPFISPLFEKFIFSIHAPREGSDWARTLPRRWGTLFNPRSP